MDTPAEPAGAERTFRRYLLALAATLVGFTTVAGYVVGANAGDRSVVPLLGVLPVPATPAAMAIAGALLGVAIVTGIYGVLRVLSSIDDDPV